MFNVDKPSDAAPPPPKVYVNKGLAGQDDHLDLLQKYFKDLQTMTVETSMSTDLDLLTFAISAHYFGVIMLETVTNGKNGCTTTTRPHQSMSYGTYDAYPPGSSAPMAPVITEEEFLALPEEERKARWREAFKAKIEGELDSDDEYEDDSSAHVRGFMPPKPQFAEMTPSPIIPSVEERRNLKGKMRSIQADPFNHSIYASTSRNNIPPAAAPVATDSADDLINWPDDASDDGGPPSTMGDGSSCQGDESSTEDPFSPFENDTFGDIEPLSPFDDTFGREFLEPEAGPAARLPEIPEDPAVKKLIMESAVRFQAQMQARTVRQYEEKKARKAAQAAQARVHPPSSGGPLIRDSPSIEDTKTVAKPIGIVYLTTSQNFSDFLHLGECNIGVYIAPEHRNLHQVTMVVNAVIEDAFRDHDCHRLQAILVDHKDKLDFLTMFTSVGFRHEGTRRHAYFSPITSEWKDVTYLAILATEWVYDHSIRSDARLLPTSLWDEVLTRHQREQEEIIKLEERKFGYGHSRLKRTSSVETIRDMTAPTPLNLDSGAESSGFTSDSSAASAVINIKRRKLTTAPLEASSSASARRFSFSSESGMESDWEVPVFGNQNQSSLFRSAESSAGSSKRSSGFGSDSSSSSHGLWDMMEDM